VTTGDTRIPIWPAPPKVTKSSLPVFCPLEHRVIIVEKFRIHLHQHPQIPLNNAKNSLLTAQEIHYGAVKDMYDFCFKNGLAQVWAYLWNRWYTPNQWKLWARSADSAIYVLKTTMVVESLWRNLKHRNLQEFNRPRLDLVTHIIITDVLPRVRRTLDYVLDLRRAGRPKALASWQEDFRHDWIDMSRPDEYRLVEKQLDWLKKPKKTKGRTERLAELDEEEHRPRGKYLTEIDRWTCSCPAYLISRFLLCKHLVREANKILDNSPLDDLSFFFTLRRERYPPYYKIPGIHYEKDMEGSDEEVEIQVVGDNLRGARTASRNSETVEQPTQIPRTRPILATTRADPLLSTPPNLERQLEDVENTEERDIPGDRDGEDDSEEEHGDHSDNDSDDEVVKRVSVVF